MTRYRIIGGCAGTRGRLASSMTQRRPPMKSPSICSRLRRTRTRRWSASSTRPQPPRCAGAPESAVEYLTRALAEPPPARARVAILRELGAAEASLQDPAGAGHLQEALSLSSQPSERAEIARELAIPLMHSGQMGEAVDLLERAAGELAPGDRELQLEARGRHHRGGPAASCSRRHRARALEPPAWRADVRGAGGPIGGRPWSSNPRGHGRGIESMRRAGGGGRLMAEASVSLQPCGTPRPRSSSRTPLISLTKCSSRRSPSPAFGAPPWGWRSAWASGRCSVTGPVGSTRLKRMHAKRSRSQRRRVGRGASTRCCS